MLTAQDVHFPAIFRVCEEIPSFWSNHCWFMIQDQSWSVPMAHLWLLLKKMGYQEENYNFWDFSITIFDIKCRLWMQLVPALVPLEAWFWYMLFLDLLSAKLCLGFLIVLIEQILHTMKVGEIWWSQAVYTQCGFKVIWNAKIIILSFLKISDICKY